MFHIDVRLAACFCIPDSIYALKSLFFFSIAYRVRSLRGLYFCVIFQTDSEYLVSHVLPLLLRAYNDNDVRIQEEVLKRSTSVAKQLDGQVMLNAFFLCSIISIFLSRRVDSVSSCGVHRISVTNV